MHKISVVFLLLLFLVSNSCSESVSDTQTGPAELPADMVDVEFVAEAPGFVAISGEDLLEKYGLEISDAKASGSRWKDDPSGEVYGVVDCVSDGKSKAFLSPDNTKVGLGCADKSGNPIDGTVIGAWRDIE